MQSPTGKGKLSLKDSPAQYSCTSSAAKELPARDYGVSLSPLGHIIAPKMSIAFSRLDTVIIPQIRLQDARVPAPDTSNNLPPPRRVPRQRQDTPRNQIPNKNPQL